MCRRRWVKWTTWFWREHQPPTCRKITLGFLGPMQPVGTSLPGLQYEEIGPKTDGTGKVMADPFGGRLAGVVATARRPEIAQSLVFALRGNGFDSRRLPLPPCHRTRSDAEWR